MTNASVAHLLRNLGDDPDNGALYFMLGNEYKKLGLLAQAIAAYEEAIARNVDHLGSYLSLSETQERLLLVSKARETLERGLALAREKGYALGERYFETRLQEFDARYRSVARRDGTRNLAVLAPFALRKRSSRASNTGGA